MIPVRGFCLCVLPVGLHPATATYISILRVVSGQCDEVILLADGTGVCVAVVCLPTSTALLPLYHLFGLSAGLAVYGYGGVQITLICCQRLMSVSTFGVVVSGWLHCLWLVSLSPVDCIVSDWCRCLRLVALSPIGVVVSGWLHCLRLVSLSLVGVGVSFGGSVSR